MDGLFFVLVFIFAAAALLSSALSSTRLKGKLGEFLVHRMLNNALPRSHYSVLRDVTLRTDRGTTQIDHIVVSPYGIFVIETKHMSGWVFGSAGNAKWTQSFLRSKRRFQNPLRQNYSHIKTLQELLRLEASKFHSMVVFTGSARFKTDMPVNVMRKGGLIPFIQIRTRQLIDFDEVAALLERIENNRLPPGLKTDALHIASLKARHQAAPGELTGGRQKMRHARAAFNAVRLASGVVLIAALLLAGNNILNNVGAVYSDTGAATAVVAPAPKINPFVQEKTPPALPAQHKSRPEPVPLTRPQASPDKFRPEQATRKQLEAIEAQRLWQASLMCAYSSDARRCACYEPKGKKVDMAFAACKTLADRNRGAVGRSP